MDSCPAPVTMFLSRLDRMRAMLVKESRQGRVSQQVLDLGHTLVAGTDSNRQRLEPASESGYAAFHEYIQNFHAYPPDIHSLADVNSGVDLAQLTAASHYWFACRQACLNRSFFTTRDGYMGLGDKYTQAGDVVALLYGARTPFVLRPYGDYFTVVGPCYVHGTMDGEYLDGCRSRQQGRETFLLR